MENKIKEIEENVLKRITEIKIIKLKVLFQSHELTIIFNFYLFLSTYHKPWFTFKTELYIIYLPSLSEDVISIISSLKMRMLKKFLKLIINTPMK